MLLTELRTVNSSGPVDIAIMGSRIEYIGRPGSAEFHHQAIDCVGLLAIPGLINSHDHLDFNCFSPLGTKVYQHYTEWGRHIHSSYKNEINKVLQIPAPLRTAWGIYKNLLAGVTTVVNHGQSQNIDLPLINILQDAQNLHSVMFQENWKWQLNNPLLRHKTCVIHAGEGTNEAAFEEINQLLRWNLLRKKIIAVHGLAMTAAQAKKIYGLVWCPESNRVLFNRHAAVASLQQHTKIALGTDSTLTGHWSIWHHLRLARSLQQLSDGALFETVNKTPARLWKLNTGKLEAGKDADIVLIKPNSNASDWDGLYNADPSSIQLVIHKGCIRLFDAQLLPVLRHSVVRPGAFSSVDINGATKMVQGDLPALAAAIRQYYPAVQLPAGIHFHPQNTPVC
jgi:cytosine/adenosine deaminase-related metal-dependent hydrolase